MPVAPLAIPELSIGDVVKYLIVEKDFKIKNLETYISG